MNNRPPKAFSGVVRSFQKIMVSAIPFSSSSLSRSVKPNIFDILQRKGKGDYENRSDRRQWASLGQSWFQNLARAWAMKRWRHPQFGVNSVTGRRISEAMKGALVIVDVSNAPAWEDSAVLNFFET